MFCASVSASLHPAVAPRRRASAPRRAPAAAPSPRQQPPRSAVVAMASSITRLEVGARMSEASVFNGIVHLAGQVADNADDDICGQTKQVLAAVDRLLAAAGSDKTRILMCQIYLKNIADFPGMNSVWDTWVSAGATPPRATVQATLANEKWLIEVVVTAAVK